MGATVQSKTYFTGSITDLNNGFHNGVWNLCNDDKSQKISTTGNSQHYDYFLTKNAMDGCTGYAKEQIRQTILKHETIFKHQLQELHRLYKRQRDLMNPVPVETSNFGHFLRQVPSDVSKEMNTFASSFPLLDSTFSRASTSATNNTFSHLGSILGKSTLKDLGSIISKCGVSDRRVIELKSPVDVDKSNKGKLFNLADLNEPNEVEERETAFSTFFSNRNRTYCLADEPQKREFSAKRTIFGVEIGEKNHTSSYNSLQTPTFHSLPWLNSSGSSSQNPVPGFFVGNSRLTTNSASENCFSGSGVQNGINCKNLVSDSLEKSCAQEKHRFLDMWKNRETPEQTLPPWLTAKPCLHSGQIKVKETPVHHINLDLLQNYSQQFFKKNDMAESNDTRECKKVKIDDTQSITKILGGPIFNPKVESHCESNGKKHHIDLNLSLDEEDAPSLPESVVKIATMEIDLEAPAVLESDSDDGSMDTHTELVKVAAKAIVSFVSISLSQPPPVPSADSLLWFAEVITSKGFKKKDNSVPEGMDYFEYMTLQLEDTEESYDIYKPMIVEDQKEEKSGSSLKRTARKGQGKRGRQKKDFQKDILPSIVSLSRREVTEDLQIFEEALSATGVTWQSSFSKRKAAARNGRGRRRLLVLNPPPQPLAVVVEAAGEPTICRELSLEKSLGGWGRRTRRLPRQRCQNGGNHRSLALKC